ncbi:Golgi transport complex subunit 5-domain-containing protein [Coprinopsis sp. MPI-PUGE-AT-0042]|nr:Golgi transport complex subunit 5-domain-containing protein [Coprinopsis sp. MPI-PUGE-AT-0042]
MSDYSVFASQDFNPNDYANAILAGEPYPPSTSDGKGSFKQSKASHQDSVGKEDISVAISKLTFGIDDISKQIKSLVTTHHEHLLIQAASANNLSGSLGSVRSGLTDLNSSLDKLQQKVHVPYQNLQLLVTRLKKLQQASDILRRTSRFVILARRLQLQMKEVQTAPTRTIRDSVTDSSGLTSATVTQTMDIEDDKERAVAKAALTISEISGLLDGSTAQDDNLNASSPVSLRTITAVAAFEGFIEEARANINDEMEHMVINGLKNLNPTLLASSLQTAFNLGVLPQLVSNLLIDLSQTVEDRIKSAFDLSKISKDAAAKEPLGSPQPASYKSRVRTEPTNITAPQFTSALWTRLEGMFDEMSQCCVKVYALEKVLKIKKDATTQVNFLDDVVKVLESKPSAIFWLSLSRALDKHFKDSAKASPFLQQALVSGYPKLLRLFHQFFSRISVHTDTVYSDSQQSPETVLVLRSLANIDAGYLTRCVGKMNEAVTQAFVGGSRAPPTTNDAANVARSFTNELDSAKFDPLLVKAVARNVSACLDHMVSKVDAMVIQDRSAVSLLGPTATPQAINNAQLVTFLYQVSERLDNLKGEHTEGVFRLLQTAIKVSDLGGSNDRTNNPWMLQRTKALYQEILEPMQNAVQREIGAILVKVHRIDFGQTGTMPGGASLCMRELTDKLGFIKSEILNEYNIGEVGAAWATSIVRFTIRNFLFHISIAKPLSESGKLQMTSDMAELEFALNAFMAEKGQKRGDGNLHKIEEYRALRSMRPMLFLENSQLAKPEKTLGLPPIVVLHHILVRSPIPLPHKLHGWQESEYVRWLDEHTDEESWTLIDGGLSHWEKISETEGEIDSAEAKEYVELARTVLQICRDPSK